jgi:uroporphyrinogen decarboxylase
VKGVEFQAEVLRRTRAKLPADKSLIGFVGGPWTLYVYATEGGHSGNLTRAKARPELFGNFCEALTPLLIRNIELQLDSGAEAVMIFDTAAGELSPSLFDRWASPQLSRILSRFPKRVAYYSKGTTQAHYKSAVLQDGAWAGLGYDHRFSLPEILKSSRAGFVQGNFDQALLFLPPAKFDSVFKSYLEDFQKLSPEQRAGWVCGLGHGVLPATPEENVRSFVRLVREFL